MVIRKNRMIHSNNRIIRHGNRMIMSKNRMIYTDNRMIICKNRFFQKKQRKPISWFTLLFSLLLFFLVVLVVQAIHSTNHLVFLLIRLVCIGIAARLHDLGRFPDHIAFLL